MYQSLCLAPKRKGVTVKPKTVIWAGPFRNALILPDDDSGDRNRLWIEPINKHDANLVIDGDGYCATPHTDKGGPCDLHTLAMTYGCAVKQ